MDNNNQNLKYATNSSGNWNYYSIHDEQNESAGLHNQLELYGGKVHFAYSISNTIGYTMSLGYATFDGNSVEKKTVDDIQNVGQSTDLVISSLGEISISYFDDSVNWIRVIQYNPNQHNNPIQDSSINSYNVESNGKPLSNYDSKYLSGIYFDGVDDYLGGTNYSTTLGSFIGTGEFTLSAWSAAKYQSAIM